MIRDVAYWREWEAKSLGAEPVDHARNLRWFDAALQHADRMGVWRRTDPLEGIEHILRMAAILNGRRDPGPTGGAA